MDIRKLVNSQAQARPSSDVRAEWPAHQTLPPFSSMFPDPSYSTGKYPPHLSSPVHLYSLTGYHYPIPPHGEGYNGYAHQYYQQQPSNPPVYVQQSLPPSYSRQMDVPYLQSANPAARSSSSAVSVSSTKFSSASSTTSSSSGPATSAERRSLSDEEDDDESDADDISGASSPLPPYQYSPPQPQYAAPPQQVCFLDNQHQQPQQPQSVDAADFVCDDCGVSYSRAPDLRRHKASVHNDRDSREKVAATFPCEVCGQVLLSSHGYQGHMRRHYDERPFVCEAPFCGKAFHDSATLARHRRTHSTEHKFECDFCGRRFKRKDNLNTHRKKHQVGGESINPNLLRKPVTRVAADSPPAGTPQAPAYGELPLTSPPYQSPLPSQLQQPSYIPSDQHTYPQHHYTQNPPPPTYYPQHMPYQQRPHYTTVKAEDPTEMDLMRSAQHRRMVMVGNMGPANR